MQAGSRKRFIAAGLLCVAGMGVLAQTQQTYQAQVQAGRVLSADEQQVLLLVNESAALLDQGRTEPAAATARRALELAKTTRMECPDCANANALLIEAAAKYKIPCREPQTRGRAGHRAHHPAHRDLCAADTGDSLAAALGLVCLRPAGV